MHSSNEDQFILFNFWDNHFFGSENSIFISRCTVAGSQLLQESNYWRLFKTCVFSRFRVLCGCAYSAMNVLIISTARCQYCIKATRFTKFVDCASNEFYVKISRRGFPNNLYMLWNRPKPQKVNRP